MARSSHDDEALAFERHELALRASNEGIWDWDLQRERIYYSERILEFLNFAKADAPNYFLQETAGVHPDESAEFFESLEQYLKYPQPNPLALEARLRRSDDSWCWMRIRAVVLRNSKDQPIRVAGSMIDINQRKRTEAALQEERHLFRLLIENVPESIYFKDLASNFILTNSATAKKLNAPSIDAVIGTSDDDYFDPAHAEKSRNDEKYIMQTGRPIISALNREKWHDREDTWVVTTKLPWLDRQGKLKGTFGITSDVTKLIKTREKLKRTAKALEKRNKLYREEIQLAMEIQSALVPDNFPSMRLRTNHIEHRLSFAHRFYPSTELAGDYLDVFQISPTKSAIIVCDVMGHGVRSALVVSMIRGLIEEVNTDLGDPAHVLRRLNNVICGILKRAKITLFATMTIAVIDIEQATVTCASAGHPWPILCQHDHPPKLLEFQRGPAIGLASDFDYSATKFEFPAPSRLFLFTDGVTEISNSEGEEWGEQSVINALQQVPEGSISKIDAWVEHLISRAIDYSPEKKFHDDVCLIGAQLVHQPLTGC